MTRKAWTPDPTLSTWVTFPGKAIALLVVSCSGMFLFFNGVAGVREMRVDITSIDQKVDSVTVEVDDLRLDFERFVLLDSIKRIGDVEHQQWMECAVGTLADGETLGYSDCAPNGEGVSQ